MAAPGQTVTGAADEVLDGLVWAGYLSDGSITFDIGELNRAGT
ncbi:MAG: hypothetical protein ABIO16_01390 [Nocardioides sp.]